MKEGQLTDQECGSLPILSRVKLECFSITERRAHKARAEQKLNFGNALAYGVSKQYFGNSLVCVGFIYGIKIDAPFREWAAFVFCKAHLENKTFTRRAEDCSALWLDEQAPTSAPTWMDGSLIGFSFLSLSHPRLTFFVCPFSALISVVFLELLFLPAPLLVFFFFFCF